MAKYINADDIEYMKRTFCYGHGWYEDEEYVLKEKIDEMPAADVRENEYSHKVWCPDGSKELQCAECRAFVDLEDKYCHECGRILLSEG